MEKSKKFLAIIILLFQLLAYCQSLNYLLGRSINNNNGNIADGGGGISQYSSLSSSNSRLQCDYKDINGDSLVLNCSLVSGTAISMLNNNIGTSIDSNGISIVNSADSQMTSMLGAGGAPIGSLRIGLDKYWRTPWESLAINYNIIYALIWQNSRLRELGEYAFKDLRYLQHIDLSHNRIAHLSSYSFKSFESDLLELDLSDNLFEQIPIDPFLNVKLQKLETLRLNENPIVHIHRRPFEYLKSLKSLELNNCQIRSIDTNAFENMNDLESVSLIGNQIKYLNEQTFKNLNLRSFYVHDNPITCDCHMRWLINYIKNVDLQQQSYEPSNIVPLNEQHSTASVFSSSNSRQPTLLSVSAAAQTLLRCDQPNSLRLKTNFLEINPDSFMCDVQISLREQNNNEDGVYEMGDEAVLVCDVYGDPEPHVYWSFGQKPIEKGLNDEYKYSIIESRSTPLLSSSSSFLLLKSPSQLMLATNKTSELRIKNLQSGDVGMYACTAEISGSNNRKQASFFIKQVKGSGLSSLSSAGGIVVGSVGILASATSSFFNRPLSNWTLILILAIIISILVFIILLISFICWKCRRSANKNRLIDKKFSKDAAEKLLINGTLGGSESDCNKANMDDYKYDQLDSNNLHNHLHHHHNNHNINLPNESSATLLSTNKMTNSIRMAYPNSNTLNQKIYHQSSNNNPMMMMNGGQFPMNEVYTNHSLLTTTSTTTGSYIVAGNPATVVAIDTSNQTPRYMLIPPQQQQQPIDNGYYDETSKYNNIDELSKQQQQSSSYSPIIRRDDPTVPLYATLKPKLQQHHQQQQQQQQQQQRQYSNSYMSYSTIHRSNGASLSNTPPLPMPRRANYLQQIQMDLPPPPPPPPTKPKRTFEYSTAPNNHHHNQHLNANRNELHSDSGAYLLGDESFTPTTEYDHNDLLACTDSNATNFVLMYPTSNNNSKPLLNGLKSKLKQQQHQQQQQIESNGGSTTSLDEEDLDLNDLKDFEDVTFDNLRKPGEQRSSEQQQQQQQLKQSNSRSQLSAATITNNKQSTAYGKETKRLKNSTENSDQSLLMKSQTTDSSSSSPTNSTETTNTTNLNATNTINNNHNDAIKVAAAVKSGGISAANAANVTPIDTIENHESKCNYEETEI